MSVGTHAAVDLPVFDRNFWDGTFRCTRIGAGALGGKASGLALARNLLADKIEPALFADFDINVPTMAVIATGFFHEFMVRNRLFDLQFEELSDARIGHAFQQADLPVELLGDLRALIAQVTTPLAIRSSSLFEDALDRPFAGVYATKMIPNNQFDTDTRFRRLVEAIKYVYASTYFREARDYIRTTGREPREEEMAVILQEVVGRRHGDRFYPDVSGVARSYNFYPIGSIRPEDGVASLALGLGKTIVDGSTAWTFSPVHPKRRPPFGSMEELLQGTQTEFWAVNMGKPPAYDPVNEVEYLVHANLKDAEADEVLRFVASTYDSESDILIPGVSRSGVPVLTFAPLLEQPQLPLSGVIQALLRAAESIVAAKVEIEFAVTIQHDRGQPRARLGFLQVRPMAFSEQVVDLAAADLADPSAIVASDMVMGNGIDNEIRDIVYVRPDHFSPQATAAVAADIASMNRELMEQHRPYLLIGFGRWGSSQSSLGIPVDWSQIAGARAIVEATLPQMNVDLSQGSHFFHNLSSFHASYFMVRHDRQRRIDWEWLERQPVVQETQFVRHVRTADHLTVRVDGRTARGVIVQAGGQREVP